MRGMNKKILISLLTTLVVFITVFATTYAWVGIFTYANTDSFKMNLKVQDLDSNYFLTISSSGKPGDFSDEVPSIELKRQILKNKIKDQHINIDSLSDDELEILYNRNIEIKNSTTHIEDNKLTKFQVCDYSVTSYMKLYDSDVDFYKFDLYLSVDSKEGIQDTTYIDANVYLEDIENTLIGTAKEARLTNGNPFMDLPSDSLFSPVLKSIPNSGFLINSANAARFALCIYNPIPITSEYQDENPNKTIIFQGGSQNPTYDEINNIYNLGGVLPDEYNLMAKELKIYRPNYSGSTVPSYREIYYTSQSYAINRNDLELIDDNKQLWDKHIEENYLGCKNGIQTKMKITVYFWFEGWDADNIKEINRQLTTLNLTFTSGTDD